MLTIRIIPCLDVRSGRVVKGVRFQNLRDMGDPATLAAAHEAAGADELVVLDITATDEARGTRLETVRSVRAAIGIPLTIGGGVRAAEDVESLLEAGADKVAVNTAAILDPALITALAARFGAQCVVASIDCRSDPAAASGFTVVSHAGKVNAGLDLAEWAARVEALGAGEIVLTSWNNDGTGGGYDLDAIRRVRARVNLPVIASGGAATAGHFIDAARAGADALLAATVFHERPETIGDTKRALAQAGVPIRL